MAATKLYNKGKRTFLGNHPDALDQAGKPKAYAFKPDSSAEFHADEANKLRKLYPSEIVSLEDVKREFDEKTSAPTVTVDKAQRDIAAAVEAARADERAKVLAELAVQSKDEDGKKEPALEDEEKTPAKKK